MTERSGVFLLQGDDHLVGMEPAQFVSEDDFQRLLERFPDLLVGDQIDPANPRKWLLVKREQQVSTGEAGASIWAIDHVFLDQDGIPTLVEVKRKSDTRLRREVVGQMLDYAANCNAHWSVELLQTELERTCNAKGITAQEALDNLIGSESNVDEFWRRVRDNLQSRNIRLLFVADFIPLELRRIVEFLNEEMKQVEVLAIELRQFSSSNLKAIVPTIYGQTQASAQKRNVGRLWDEASIFGTLANTATDRELEIAKQIYGWMRQNGKRAVKFGSGQSGSVYPVIEVGGTRINPIYLSTSGKIYIQFGALLDKPVFGPVDVRRELMRRANKIPGVNLTDSDLTKYPNIPLKAVAADPNGSAQLMALLQWIDSQIEHYRAAT